MKRKKKTYDDDDGRIIANMNVPGMPGYVERRTPRVDDAGTPLQTDADELYGKDLWRFMRSAIAAAMVVAGVIVAGMVLFTLFCTEIWLR
ncbi:MAG: hypothetical protein ACOYI3_04705 [Christensenellales bacterium]|jgi:hypothetical protein